MNPSSPDHGPVTRICSSHRSIQQLLPSHNLAPNLVGSYPALSHTTDPWYGFLRNHFHLCIRSFGFDEEDFGFKVDRFGFLEKKFHLYVRRLRFDEEELGFRRQFSVWDFSLYGQFDGCWNCLL
ncbi:hypothetical protein ACOSQ2_018405 [Xanthoceras sorbifolium]